MILCWCQRYHFELWWIYGNCKVFVTGEYIIRPVSADDVDEWERNSNYNEEAYAFAEAVINKYKECYTL